MSLQIEIESLLQQNADDYQISKHLKKAIKSYLENLEETFKQTQGKAFLVHHTKKIDLFLSLIYKIVLRKMFGSFQPMRNSVPIALVALGSYGREQLCVYSDIDLMIVYQEIPGYNVKAIIEKILYIAWDAGLNLGHRVHQISELLDAANEDITIKTALIESRFIIGSNFIWMQTEQKIKEIKNDNPRSFILSKLEEARIRHDKHPLSMEPEVKEGIGGMRDANLAFWIASIRFNVGKLHQLTGNEIEEQDYTEYRKSLEFIFRVRAALHLSARKKMDTLRLELVPSVADFLGIGKDNPIKAQRELVSKTLQSLDTIRKKTAYWTSLFCKPYLFDITHIKRLKTNRIEKGIFLCDKKLFCRKAYKRPSMFYLLKLMNKEAASISFDTDPSFCHLLDRVKVPQTKNRAFKQATKQIFYQAYSASVIEALYVSGKLAEVISAFKRVLYLPQFDGYHHYPVDIHSIKTLKNLDMLNHPLLSSLFKALDKESRALLKVVALLHDTGKGRVRDHSEVGAKLFKLFATKIGFSQTHIKNGILLIKYHTSMTYTIHNEDIYAQSTVSKFIAPIKEKKLLDMLFILTFCDINAVGKGIYNAFTDRMLTSLYHSACEMIEKPAIVNEATKRIRKEAALKKQENFIALPKSTQKKILSIESNLFFIKHSSSQLYEIALHALNVKDYAMIVETEQNLRIKILRKIPINLGYLLGKLSHMDLVSMEIFKLFDMIKYFTLEFSETVTKDEIPLIEQIIHDSFDMDKKIKLPLIRINKKDVSIDCEHSKTYAMMQIKTANQKGLMAYIVHYLDLRNIDIATATITTRQHRVNDLFMIEKDGVFCKDKNILLKHICYNSLNIKHK